MIQVSASTTIVVMHDPISFRSGIRGTTAIAREVLLQDPMNGSYFVFRSRRGIALRILFYDGSGFWLATKQLSAGTFNKIWPKGDCVSSKILARELGVLIWGGDSSKVFPDLWRKVG
jgi:transposase